MTATTFAGVWFGALVVWLICLVWRGVESFNRLEELQANRDAALAQLDDERLAPTREALLESENRQLHARLIEYETRLGQTAEYR